MVNGRYHLADVRGREYEFARSNIILVASPSQEEQKTKSFVGKVARSHRPKKQSRRWRNT